MSPPRDRTATLGEVDRRDPAARQALGRYLAEITERFGGDFDPGPVSDDGHWLVGRDTRHPRRAVAYGAAPAR